MDRPKALNALCDGLMLEVAKALDEFEVNQKFLLTPTLALGLRKNLRSLNPF